MIADIGAGDPLGWLERTSHRRRQVGWSLAWKESDLVTAGVEQCRQREQPV